MKSKSKPKFKVEESNGELSMSVEETNKLRASLGLPPLEVDTPAPQPSQQGDELSLSVEETNKLRAKLGLPPLEESPPASASAAASASASAAAAGKAEGAEEGTVDAEGFVVIDMEKQRREAAIRAKLEESRARRERESLAHLQGKGLGAILSAEAPNLSLKDWVKRGGAA